MLWEYRSVCKTKQARLSRIRTCQQKNIVSVVWFGLESVCRIWIQMWTYMHIAQLLTPPFSQNTSSLTPPPSHFLSHSSSLTPYLFPLVPPPSSPLLLPHALSFFPCPSSFLTPPLPSPLISYPFPITLHLMRLSSLLIPTINICVFGQLDNCSWKNYTTSFGGFLEQIVKKGF